MAIHHVRYLSSIVTTTSSEVTGYCWWKVDNKNILAFLFACAWATFAFALLNYIFLDP